MGDNNMGIQNDNTYNYPNTIACEDLREVTRRDALRSIKMKRNK